LIQSLAANGKSVIVISSYLPELIGTCHTLAVMHRGTLSGKRPTREWRKQEIMLFATTGKESAQ
jgi:ABC-type sugar transport system ATPase subunit